MKRCTNGVNVGEFTKNERTIKPRKELWILLGCEMFVIQRCCILQGSLHTSQVAHQAGAYPGFCGMKRLGVFLLPPSWDVCPPQGYTQH